MQMETSSLYRRVSAYLVDSFILAMCFLPVWIQLIGSYLNDGVWAVSISWLLVGFLFQLFYKWLFLYFLGGTIGKLLFGLRVVPAAHPENSLGLFQSLLRVLTDSLSIFFGQALRAAALIRLDRTHVSDWVAETRVMQFEPLRSPPTRHWILAILVVVITFCAQFQKIYQTFQSAEIADGEIVFDASY